MLDRCKEKQKRATKDEVLNRITNSTYVSLSKLWEIVKNRGTWHATVHKDHILEVPNKICKFQEFSKAKINYIEEQPMCLAISGT